MTKKKKTRKELHDLMATGSATKIREAIADLQRRLEEGMKEYEARFGPDSVFNKGIKDIKMLLDNLFKLITEDSPSIDKAAVVIGQMETIILDIQKEPLRDIEESTVFLQIELRRMLGLVRVLSKLIIEEELQANQILAVITGIAIFLSDIRRKLPDMAPTEESDDIFKEYYR